jgi:mercuric ion binding protein
MRLPAILFSMLLALAAHAAASQTVTLDVSNMTCSVCPITVRKALGKVPGVEDVRVDFESKTATVRFDPAQTTPVDLARASQRAGYPASVRK